MIKDMVKEFIHGKMAIIMMVNGLMICKMDMDMDMKHLIMELLSKDTIEMDNYKEHDLLIYITGLLNSL